ncbi:MAG TPA: hypothetical protein VHW23_17695 [Kofleriaceae bacterium]|nr:hypothetical protein [Kofleriaceae bacterium]
MTSLRTAPARAILVTVVLALGRIAGAQPASPAPDDSAKATEAAALYDEGKRYFDIGEYPQAIASWKRSYLLSSAPLLLFNIAQAYRLSGNCAQANRFYLNYRRAEPHPRNGAELDKAMARCAGVEPATGDASDAPPAGAAAPPAGAAPVALPPAPQTAPATDAGSHTDAAPPATHAQAVEPPSGRGLRIAGLVTGAVGVAALAASGLYAIGARQDSDTVSGARMGTPYAGDVASTDSSGKTAASRARGLVGVGAALAIAGGAMWYIGYRQGARLDVAIAPGHAEVALSCAF